MTLEVAPEDSLTRHLARTLLVTEIAVQVLTCFVVAEMLDHGQLVSLFAWRWRRFRERMAAQQEADRVWRVSMGRMLFEAETVLKGEDAHG